MEFLSKNERSEIAKILRSKAIALVELAWQLEQRETVINTNCALGAVIDLLQLQSDKVNTASEKEYEAKKRLINIL